MFFDFRFWKYLFHQGNLMDSLKEATMRGFEKRVVIVAFLGVLLFALRDIWGMHTEALTSIFVNGFEDTYTVARITSLIGAVIASILYMAFHFFGIAFLLHKIINVELSKVAVLQLFVVALLLMEKALIFFMYAIVGYATDFSILSFGPLAATYLNNEFIIYFFNQLTIVTGLIIAIQFQFLRTFTTMSTGKLLSLLIAIQIILALITAGMYVLPLETWFEGGQPA
ncbi:hypothetical protein [Psychrobacillus vulpis]|uniref:Yip1 domain-containing protein n=1 Tax=Psychrobacillus vulpis TaxID=2325572 RepID=A0A544TUT7_9BACI|nr:hypothetical protein [Psychrobacillus vulpis]TQR21196.1 hypothetical protein FG384_03030 [Psychrobacillus vulpis]